MPTAQEIRRRLFGLAPTDQPAPAQQRPPQFAGPVERGFQGTAQPVQPRPQQFAGPVQRVFQGSAQPADPRFQRQPVFSPRVPQQDPNFSAQQQAAAANQAQQNLQQLQGQFSGQRPPMFNGNFATPSQQMQAGQQGALSQMPRQRPFASYYAGQRQGRGGLQPVASPQDAAFRQRFQESAARNNRFANTAGNTRMRTLQRRPVFA